MRKLLCNHEARYIGDDRKQIGRYSVGRSFVFDLVEVMVPERDTDDFLIGSSYNPESRYKKWRVS